MLGNWHREYGSDGHGVLRVRKMGNEQWRSKRDVVGAGNEAQV